MASSSTKEPQKNRPVLRVNQLDSHHLDDEILHLLKAQLNNVFHFFQPGVLSVIEPELNVLLRLILWKFSIDKSSSTFGQQMLELHYGSSGGPGVMTPRQKWLYAFMSIGCRWFQDRAYDLSKVTDQVQAFDVAWTAIDWIERILKVISVINFFVFLRLGTYQTILERIVGIKARFTNPQSVREVSFEFMTRELLWHGFAEFLFFLIPFVNFHRLKNNIRRRLLIGGDGPSAQSKRSKVTYEECAVCGEWPTNPHEIGCQHVFCYYCIQANYEADNSYTCPLCGFPSGNQSNIKPVLCDVR